MVRTNKLGRAKSPKYPGWMRTVGWCLVAGILIGGACLTTSILMELGAGLAKAVGLSGAGEDAIGRTGARPGFNARAFWIATLTKGWVAPIVMAPILVVLECWVAAKLGATSRGQHALATWKVTQKNMDECYGLTLEKYHSRAVAAGAVVIVALGAVPNVVAAFFLMEVTA